MFIVCFLFFLIFLPVLFLLVTSVDTLLAFDGVYLFVWFVADLCISFGLANSIINAGSKLFSTFFYIYAYCFILIPSLLQVSVGEFPWGGVYDSETLQHSMVLVIVSVLAYMSGQLLANSQSLGRKNKQSMEIVFSKYFEIFSFLSIVLVLFLIFFVVGYELFLQPRYFFNRVLIDRFGLDGFMVLNSIIRVIPFVMVAYVFQFYTKKDFKNVGRFFVFVLSCFLFLITTNPFVSARFWFATCFIAVLFILLSRFEQRRIIGWFCFSLVVGMFLIFPIMDYFRYGGEGEVSGGFYENIVISGDFDSYQQILNSIIFSDLYGFLYGGNFISSVFFFVPRFLWPGKLPHSGELVSDYLNYDYLNLSAPLVAESYLAGGVFFVLIIFFVWGGVSKIFEYGMKFNFNGCGFILLTFLAVFQIFLMRGSLMSAVSFLVPVILYWYAFRKIAVKEVFK